MFVCVCVRVRVRVSVRGNACVCTSACVRMCALVLDRLPACPCVLAGVCVGRVERRECARAPLRVLLTLSL